MSATHYGHCQACGRRQKLPKGKLSLHGYVVRWSHFLGDCPGSKELPFEVSKDLIERYIAYAEADLKATRERIALLSRPYTAADLTEVDGVKGLDNVEINIYQPEWASRTNRGYRWILGRLTLSTDLNARDRALYLRRPLTLAAKHTDKTYGVTADSVYATKTEAENLDALIATANREREYYVRSVLLTNEAQRVDYIAWQKVRIANWAPAELEPVK